MYKLTILGNERLRQGKKPQQNCLFIPIPKLPIVTNKEQSKNSF